MSKQGKWLVLEGGEGAGKSSVIRRLAEFLESTGSEVVVTREPGGTPEGLALRSLLLSDAGPQWDPAAELLLMAAARVQHVRRVIEPALASGKVVLCDRYVGSSIAYQGAGRGLSESFIRQLHAETTGDAWPDLTLILDVDPLVGLQRSKKRLSETAIDEGRFEQLDISFHKRVRESFLAQASQDPNSIVIDATRPMEEVIDTALSAVGSRLGTVR